jgi:hypothetical protein
MKDINYKFKMKTSLCLQRYNTCEIQGSRSSEDVDVGLLGCNTM